MKNVLITGGNGYIARNLAPLLKAGGYNVFAPPRQVMDLLNPDNTMEQLEQFQPEFIIHTAVKGGRRHTKDTWEDVFVPNVRMWEHLFRANLQVVRPHAKIITLGSGAEYDRRWNIQYRTENTVKFEWPIDPYGLSKNIITRRVLEDLDDAYVLRLFGCFNWDDDPSKFIIAGINNLKRGLPVEVHKNREFDYFYLDDIYTVIDYIIQTGTSHQNINLVYKDKVTLVDIAGLIHKHFNKFTPITMIVDANGWADAYCGSGTLLHSMGLKLIGLDEGIRRTVLKLT